MDTTLAENNINKIIHMVCDDFITDEEGKELIEKANKNFTKASVLGQNFDDKYRVADNTWLFDNENQIATILKEKISNLINVPVENFESLHVVKYNVGGEYKEHHDFFHANTDYFEKTMKCGGQRTHTALIYLNDDFEGGETDFPNIGYRAIPKKNKLIIWKNVDDDNQVENNSLHAGLPVTKGTKYIAIFWIREKKFI